MDTFRKVVDEGREYLINIFFGDWGEPFLNRNIYEMIRYAEQNRISTSISTNLHHFRVDDDLKKVLQCGLSGGLIISLHGASEESYRAYQPGKSFSKTLLKVKKLVELKKDLMLDRPDIKLMFAISKKNQHEIDAMKKLANNLGLPYKMYSASINARYYLNDRQKLSDLINEWAQDGAFEESENEINENKNKIADFYKELHSVGGLDFKVLEKKGITGRHFCMDPWKTAVVSWNGDISLCCVDYLKYKMGNINEATLKQIWNSAEYKNVRQFFIDPFKTLPSGHPCRKCLLY
jgi:radical SAM protein with 4Fe4S-binding SPASM domain